MQGPTLGQMQGRQAFTAGTLALRTREARDDAGLLGLFNEPCFLAGASTREPFGSAADMRLWLDGVAAAQRFESVALIDAAVVGFAGLYALGDGQSHSGWLMLGVREALQGRGIGTILLNLLVSTAQSFAGLARLQLTVFTDNLPAIALYRKFGFEIEGLHRRFVQRGEGFVDAYTMARLLEPVDFDAKSFLRQRAATAEWDGQRGRRLAAEAGAPFERLSV